MSNPEPKSPLTIIAIFAGIIEASALASLPFLSEDSQNTYTWFLVGFPFFLTVLFFLTLNFNYKSLYSPSAVEPTTPTIAQAPQQPATKPETSVSEILSAPVEDANCNEVINTSMGNGIRSVQKPGTSLQYAQTRVTIAMSGASANKVLEHFVLQALNQTQPLCSTWILHNLETGTQTTLATQLIDK
ncbi:hypothetical protein D3C78_1215590 [compost metagenome]